MSILHAETKTIKNYYKELEISAYLDISGIGYLDSIEIQHPASEQALECIAVVGWNTSLRSSGENFKNTNEAAEKITLDNEQESNDTNEEEEEEENQDGTSYSGESDEADDDF